jgi:hypothetical protein
MKRFHMAANALCPRSCTAQFRSILFVLIEVIMLGRQLSVD